MLAMNVPLPASLPLPFSLAQAASGPAQASHPALGRSELHTLHPALWRAHQLGRSAVPTTASGHAALDAELPGHGWPHQALTELLLPCPGVGEMRLLAPALVALTTTIGSPHATGGGHVLLFAPPAALSSWALAEMGVDTTRLLCVQARLGVAKGAGARAAVGIGREGVDTDLLWALEQALASGQAAAVLAWLPARLNAQALRRLQLAAQAHEGPAFLLRPDACAQRPSPAPLRLQLAPTGPDALAVQVLKRRGPACAQAVHIALAPVLEAADADLPQPVRAPSAA
jgi:protein ImuA